MKKSLSFARALALATLTLTAISIPFSMPLSAAENPAATDPKPKGRGKLVHMVSFKFKESSTPEDIRRVENAFAELPAKIPQIASFEWGTNNSPEKLDKGFTHGFVLTFRSAEDRDAYLVHPDHKAFGKIVGPHLADVFVVDFWAQKKGPDAAKKKKAKE